MVERYDPSTVGADAIKDFAHTSPERESGLQVEEVQADTPYQLNTVGRKR
jgi:hypothetical protein